MAPPRIGTHTLGAHPTRDSTGPGDNTLAPQKFSQHPPGQKFGNLDDEGYATDTIGGPPGPSLTFLTPPMDGDLRLRNMFVHSSNFPTKLAQKVM